MNNSYLVTEWTDIVTGAKGYLAIDSIKEGIACGGIRMKVGVTKEEVQRLAKTMTIKMSGLGFEAGGGKAGIDYSPNASDSKEVLARFLEAHKPFLLHTWITGEDMGTREDDILGILYDMGLNSPIDAFLNKQTNKVDINNRLKEALNLKIDGIPITDLVTGYGVATSALQYIESIGEESQNITASIQGFGSVGASSAKYLATVGVKILSVADIIGTIYCSEGLDIDLLFQAKDSKGNIDRTKLPNHYQQKSSAFWMENPVDILIPAAIADAITMDNVHNVNVRVIVEGANIPVTPEAEKFLFDKGIHTIPDFIANSGGAGLYGGIMYKNIPSLPESIFSYLFKQLSETTNKLLKFAAENGGSLRDAAYLIVQNEAAQNKKESLS